MSCRLPACIFGSASDGGGNGQDRTAALKTRLRMKDSEGSVCTLCAHQAVSHEHLLTLSGPMGEGVVSI